MDYDRLPMRLKLKIFDEWVKAFKDLGDVRREVADTIAELTIENWYKDQMKDSEIVITE